MSPRSTPDALTRARKLIGKLDGVEADLVVLLSEEGVSKPDRAWILATLEEHAARFESTLRTFRGMVTPNVGVGSGEPAA